MVVKVVLVVLVDKFILHGCKGAGCIGCAVCTLHGCKGAGCIGCSVCILHGCKVA